MHVSPCDAGVAVMVKVASREMDRIGRVQERVYAWINAHPHDLKAREFAATGRELMEQQRRRLDRICSRC